MYAVLLQLLLSTANAQSTTSLPYFEILGDLNTTGCDAAWYGGVCEDGWTASGANNSVLMTTTVSSGHHAIMIKPGSSSMNRVSRGFDVSGLSGVEFSASVVGVDGSATFGMRVVFKNSQNVTISTVDYTTVVSTPRVIVKGYDVPNNAVTAVLSWGAGNGSSQGTRLVVFADGSNHPPPCSGNCWPVPPEGPGQLPRDGQSCNTQCPGCDQSCPEGQTLVDECSIDSDTCVADGSCYCEDDTTEDTELMSRSEYAQVI